jgi:hypothetical protein
MRSYRYSRDVMAGCFQCWGSDMHWHGNNAQAVAARHHDSTGHETWVDVAMTIRYGASTKTGDAAQQSLPKVGQ